MTAPTFMGKPVSLLVFDLDGTLIDSRDDLATAVNALLAEHGRGVLSIETIGKFIGDGASMLVDRALRATGGTSPELLTAAMPMFFRTYDQHLLDHTYVYSGVLESLACLRERAPHLPMAILTNKPVGPSRRICDALGLSEFFFANYGGNSFGSKKPDPEGLQALILEASARCGFAVTAATTVLVGDSDVDVRTARAAGAHSLGCSYGLATEAMLAAAPDRVVSHAREWPVVLGLSPGEE